MGRMKELFMEMNEYYNGQIPEDATIHDFLRIKEVQNGEWKEYEDGLKKSKESKDSGYDDKRDNPISEK
jgi:hypothetical protein